jgi:hypothetical protein
LDIIFRIGINSRFANMVMKFRFHNISDFFFEITEIPTALLSCSCSCRWGETMSLNCGHKWVYCSSTRYITMESHGGMILTGEKRRTRIKTCPSATFSTKNHVWTDLVANLGLSDWQASNHMSQCTETHYGVCGLFYFYVHFHCNASILIRISHYCSVDWGRVV